MDKNGKIELSGVVDSVIYENRENGYTICEIEDENGDPVVLAGTMPYVTEGDMIKATGNWVIHPTYGKQLKVTSYEKSMPTDSASILRYLSSGVVRGVGPKTAEKIVDKFGECTFDVLDNHPEWISEINGISKKKALEISNNFKEVSGARNIMIRFKDYLSDNMSMKIYQKWGGSAIDRIKENPYILCETIQGIGFAKADAVAESFGIEKNSPFRLSAGVSAFLKLVSAREGHTCMPLEELKERCAKMLEVTPEEIYDTLLDMLIGAKLRVSTRGDVKYIYLPEYYEAEKYIASRLSAINKQCITFGNEDVGRMVFRAERENGISYDVLQKKAIFAALETGVMILTGGPGTGKTTVIKAVISIFDSLGLDVALAAPTGRAAKRMSEATSMEAKTIHRLLCMEYVDGETARFTKNEKDRLDEDVFILDESSMIDIVLMEAFLKAVKPGARVILIGDADQLPSVGAGNVLDDLISSGKFNTVKLTKIFRQEDNSLIISNAHAVNEGKNPEITNKSSDFFFLPRDNDDDIAKTLCDLYKNRLPRSYGANAVDDIQILTPSKKGICGTEYLNRMLQSYMNPPDRTKKERKFRDIVFREGDKVMQTKNNYDLAWEKDGFEGEGIFNGDIGIIKEINNAEGIFVIDFDEKICEYDIAFLEELEHAWAITVHKSQGSEYPFVVFPLYSCAPMLLCRNLFYTAITRAKRMVILVGKKYIIDRMVENDRHAVRHTGLLHMLTKED
ncbi:MAG: ATP-dependent RecD-like DNA helicase [Ruminococcaceae bacterium]|nr:ATP-dependent RecD-like DNA helicase [Oscillospiraceae bacterium]